MTAQGKASKEPAETEVEFIKPDTGDGVSEKNGAAEAAPDSEEESLQAERDRYLDLLQRNQAEFENFKKRTRREKEEWQEYLVGDIIGQLLPAIDNFGRALEAMRLDQSPDDLKNGFEMVLQQFKDLLTTKGVEEIPAEAGDAFDPELHQAVFQDRDTDLPPGKIAAVVAPGYRLNNRVIRHTQVSVSAAKEDQESPAETNGDAANPNAAD